MNINVEIGNGITIKVPSDKYYSATDEELKYFIEENMIFNQHTWHITDPFDDSAINSFKAFKEDLEETEDFLDYDPKDWE